jgi:hypothetical protein
MSVYKPKGREESIYDYWSKGDRFHGIAGREKREALKIEERALCGVRPQEKEISRRELPMKQAVALILPASLAVCVTDPETLRPTEISAVPANESRTSPGSPVADSKALHLCEGVYRRASIALLAYCGEKLGIVMRV